MDASGYGEQDWVLQKPAEIVGIAVTHDAGSVQTVVRGASLTTSWSLFASSAKPAAVGLATRPIAACIVVELALSHKFGERFLMDERRGERRAELPSGVLQQDKRIYKDYHRSHCAHVPCLPSVPGRSAPRYKPCDFRERWVVLKWKSIRVQSSCLVHILLVNQWLQWASGLSSTISLGNHMSNLYYLLASYQLRLLFRAWR
jgi:hypothetical protein